MITIGITGHPSSGKDTVADYLQSQGFSHISLGGLIKEEMAKKGIPTDRAHTSIFANEMRKIRGPGYLVEITLEKISEKTIISGLRNVAEVLLLKEKLGKNFILIAVDAPLEIRYQRALG